MHPYMNICFAENKSSLIKLILVPIAVVLVLLLIGVIVIGESCLLFA